MRKNLVVPYTVFVKFLISFLWMSLPNYALSLLEFPESGFCTRLATCRAAVPL